MQEKEVFRFEKSGNNSKGFWVFVTLGFIALFFGGFSSIAGLVMMGYGVHLLTKKNKIIVYPTGFSILDENNSRNIAFERVLGIKGELNQKMRIIYLKKPFYEYNEQELEDISNNFSKYSNIIYKSCHKISDILFHTKELYTYNEQYVSYWNTIICLPHSFPTSFKTETLSITFLDTLSEYELREKINLLAKNSQIPTFTLQQILLDWTQQIGIYLDQNGISAHKLFQNSTHDFLFQRRFHSIESFQDYFDYYWSHAKKFATNIENQKNSIQRIVEYIDHHYYEDINRSILADMVYLSADHLARIFKKETGETLVKYITDKRINAAKSLLSQTNISISQVSSQVGYDNYSYFTKIFKQRTGLSPGDYRKTYQNKM